jgi:lipoprotein-releasing system permease protein
MKLSYKIAVRFLKSNKGQTFLIILGIAIGVSVQIFIGSLIQGLQKSLIEKTIGNSPQISITADTDDKEIMEFEAVYKQIKDSTDVIALAVASDHPAFLKLDDTSKSLLIRGFQLDDANLIYKFSENIVEGRTPENENEIILGIDLLEEYELQVGDMIEIINTNQKVQELKLVGSYDLKVASINQNWGIVPLETAQTFFEVPDRITSFEIQVDSQRVFEADMISDELEVLIDRDELEFSNWKKQNEQLLSGLSGQSISSIMIQVFVMISVVLGIASVLAITVLQKSRQIGILKAMGIKNSTAGFVFLFEGTILGVFGAILGIALGLLLSVAFTKFALNPDGTPVIALYISQSFILLSGVIATLASMMAALIPAIRSSKLNPIDIIRNN